MWIEPKICRDDIDGAKKLPASGAKEDCPPCNPGMHLNGTGSTVCAYCPVKQFSDGKAGMIYLSGLSSTWLIKYHKMYVKGKATFGPNWPTLPELIPVSLTHLS